MNKKKIEKWFNKLDQQKIIDAVEDAEKSTSGEILPLITYKSDSYTKFKFQISIILTIIISTIFIMVLYFKEEFLYSLMIKDTFTLTSIFILAPTLLTFIVYKILEKNIIRPRLFVPKNIINEKVLKAAETEFYRQKISNTVDRTGILIYISILEQRVVILSDKGINEKVDTDFWDKQVKLITSGLKKREGTKSLIKVIDNCKRALSEKFPIKANDTNELSNLVIK